MKSKYTSGPWHTRDIFNTVFGPKTDRPSPETIATVFKGNKANARLIAGAPEMFDHLKFLLEILTMNSKLSEMIGQGWIDEAKAIIANVEGAKGAK